MAAKLKEYREIKGLSIEELAFKAGVDKDIITEIEKGTAKITTGKVMRKIAEALDVRVSDIFFN